MALAAVTSAAIIPGTRLIFKRLIAFGSSQAFAGLRPA